MTETNTRGKIKLLTVGGGSSTEGHQFETNTYLWSSAPIFGDIGLKALESAVINFMPCRIYEVNEDC